MQEHVGANVAICAVVKADGYGHGATECALALEAEGAAWLGVTDAAEGRALRGAGIWTRILLMTGIWRGEEDSIVAHNLTPTVWESWHIERLEKAARKQQVVLPVHLKIDTGMNRLGAAVAALPELCKKLAAYEHLRLEGVSTHFASAEVLDAGDAPQQMKRFEEALAILAQQGLHPPLVHMSNSAAVSARPDTWKTMVRPGICSTDIRCRRCGPVRRRTNRVCRCSPCSPGRRGLTVKELAAGEAVGYMGTYVTPQPSRIAVLPVGYADGYPRLLSNRARVIVRGEYAPVVGRVSMDLTMVDVGSIPGVAVGRRSNLCIGASGAKSVDAVELARLCESVPYEILCGISQRVPRVYS